MTREASPTKFSLPESLWVALEDHIGIIENVTPVAGGCVSRTLKVDARNGPAFLKLDDRVPDDFFAVEADGLLALADAGTAITIPQLIGSGAAESTSWLALEWLEALPSKTHDEVLGRELATLHRRTAQLWGWHRNGYIGTLPQSNRTSTSWAEFWWSERLAPQLELAGSSNVLQSTNEWGELRARLPELLGVANHEGPSLLHGDLWNGNVLALERGPAVVDPACYFGHREVDLAMAALFGGFDGRFFAAYEAEWPLADGYSERERVYQLYYLLVHVNLFGRGYVPSTLATLARILEA